MHATALFFLGVWILTGIGLGLFATIMAVWRQEFCPVPGIKIVTDLGFFLVAAATYLVIGFWLDWGKFSVWGVAGILAGFGLWTAWAAPVVSRGLITVARVTKRTGLILALPGIRLVRWGRRHWPRKKPPSNP